MEETTEETTGAGPGDEAVARAVAGELRLMEPAVRASRAAAAELLDPEFVEVGASGRRWTYAGMLDALPGMAGADGEGPRYRPSTMAGVLLAPGLVHLTYETEAGGRRVRRSSLWRAEGGTGSLRLLYHQGTPVPDGAG
ncbi:DUF4440 domain-containing protein [Streptomyces sp. NPDC006984]|uniref:nuclear transport factor 2 family protein n=1 Tax=Streptomyces sp. NPDC006984 TaxID=3155463 RepID=UPI0033F3753A